MDRLVFQVGDVAGSAWSAKGIELALEWPEGSGVRLALTAAEVTLPPPYDGLNGLSLQCPEASWDAAGFNCPRGALQLKGKGLPDAPLPLSLAYASHEGRVDVALLRTTLAGGHLRGEGHFGPEGWRATLNAEGLDLTPLGPLLEALLQLPAPLVPGRSVTGELQVAGDGGSVTSVHGRGSLQGLAYSDPAGLHVAEGLGLRGEVSARVVKGVWQLQGDLRTDGGQGYVDPIYVDFGTNPARIRLAARWEPERALLRLESAQLDQGAVLEATVSGTLQPQAETPLAALDVQFKTGDLGAAYATYARPYLIGTAIDALTASGAVSGTVRIDHNAPAALDAQLTGVTVEDGNQRFGVSNLGGELHWSATGDGAPSVLSWDGGHLFAVELGGARLHGVAAGDGLRLLEPLDLPVLDGRLQVGSFRLAGVSGEAPELDLEAVLTPVSMEALSTALEWPPFAGQISGVIPAVQYRNGVLSVGGALLVRAFDGELVVRDLRLAEPFGVVPRLAADVDLTALDLDALTRTFAFGTIQGRLEGRIHGLRLENWAPVAFDAAFRTPPGDTSRHRISQRAVENLTSLGGGVTGALSRGVLRFFEEFSYAEIGLTCRLAHGVCLMGGVEDDANGGYVIVKGGGLPRIDVVGYSREVDWDVLVERLRRITANAAPVIE